MCGFGAPQGFEELSEALPQLPRDDEDRDREFPEQLRDAQVRKLT